MFLAPSLSHISCDILYTLQPAAGYNKFKVDVETKLISFSLTPDCATTILIIAKIKFTTLEFGDFGAAHT